MRVLRAGDADLVVGIQEIAFSVPADRGEFGKVGVRFADVASWMMGARIDAGNMVDLCRMAVANRIDGKDVFGRLIAYAQGVARSDAHNMTCERHMAGVTLLSRSGPSVRFSLASKGDDRPRAEVAFVIASPSLEVHEDSVHCEATVTLGIDVMLRLGISPPGWLTQGRSYFPFDGDKMAYGPQRKNAPI